jgi:hypothetical protein
VSQRTFSRGAHFGEGWLDTGAPALQGAPGSPSSLERYFDAHTEGRGVWKWRHYFDIYHRHFAKFVGRDVNVLEVGVYSGGSLGMWRQYFGPRCRIYGVDIDERCRVHENNWTRILIGDQGSRDFWTRARAELPPIDILIDDGCHQPEPQIVTLEEMLPHMRRDGVYLCEDIYGGPQHDFYDYVAGLAQYLNQCGDARNPGREKSEGMIPAPMQNGIASVHLYPLVCVIEKAGSAVPDFIAPRKGTEWAWELR